MIGQEISTMKAKNLREFNLRYGAERRRLALKKLRDEPMNALEKTRLSDLNTLLRSLMPSEQKVEKRISLMQKFLKRQGRQ